MTASTGKPIWETPAGDLGTIQESEFYQLTLSAIDDSTGLSDTLYYTMIAGELPEGIQCTRTGIIEGVPKAVSSIQGVPLEVGENVTSKFTVRVYTENEDESVNRVADRTFSLTVSGQDIPEWTTPAGVLGNFIDGNEVNLQLEYKDPDPRQTVTTNLLSGTLPPGITLSDTGLLSGVLTPVVRLPGDAVPGYDVTPWDKYTWDYATRSSSQNYQFTVEVTDGRDSNVRTWSMYVYSRDDLTADSGIITADNGILTADLENQRTPYLTTPSADLGKVRHDNFFAYKFDAVDTDGDSLEFSITESVDSSYELPPGLQIDTTTGWLYGYIPDQGLTETKYTFGVQVFKSAYPSIISPIIYFTITIVGNIDSNVTWVTPETVGTLKNGEISKLSVEAVMASGAPVEYRLKTGSNSSLPQGLILQTSGNIIGQASFQGFMLDGGTTTFDEEIGTRLVVAPTVFDRTFTFTVEAFNANKQISTFKTFKIIIDQKYKRPHETVYIKALTERQDRDTLSEMLDNQDIFDPDWIYRSDDPNFGKSTSVKYQHAFGLYSSSLDDYVTAMQLNHYRRDLTLGEIKTAQALDVNGNVIYEVVYSEISNILTNSEGESVSLAVTLDNPAVINGTTYTTVYPASLLNMQTRLINQTGQFGEVLPDWMKSKQEDGTVLGFTPAWVIAYAKPGRAKQIAYNIKEKFTGKLNTIDFTIDRYTIDRRSSQHWDYTSEEWLTGAETSFDESGTETLFDGGSTRFISKADTYVSDDRFDKYVLYPKHNIIGNEDYITNG